MPLKVYYLDDEPDLCQNFIDYFENKDISIVTFTDPKKALEFSRQNPPDVFFLDYRLPSTTGDEVAKALASHIPKYLISGEVRVVTDYKFKQVFQKPFNPEAIQRILDTHLNSQSN